MKSLGQPKQPKINLHTVIKNRANELHIELSVLTHLKFLFPLIRTKERSLREKKPDVVLGQSVIGRTIALLDPLELECIVPYPRAENSLEGDPPTHVGHSGHGQTLNR